MEKIINKLENLGFTKINYNHGSSFLLNSFWYKKEDIIATNYDFNNNNNLIDEVLFMNEKTNKNFICSYEGLFSINFKHFEKVINL